MKKIGILITALLLGLWTTKQVWAQDQQKDRVEIVVEQGEEVTGPFFAAGDEVVIAGVVRGDVYIAGGRVSIEGEVDGSVWSAGGVNDISGTVSGNVTMAGGQMRIGGEVDGSLNMVGGNLEIDDSARIGGNLVVAGGNITSRGQVGGGIYGAAGNIILGSQVGGGVSVYAGNLEVTSNASIGGDLRYWSDAEADIRDGASIGGEVTRQPLPIEADVPQWRDIGGAVFGFNVVNRISSFITYLILGLLVLRFLPVLTEGGAVVIRNRFWMSLGVGLLTVFLFPVIFVFLLVTVVGIPIALVLGAFYLVMLFVSVVYASLALGETVLGKERSGERKYWALVAGLIIYEVLVIIPVLGWAIKALFVVIGLGGSLTAHFGAYKKLREQSYV